MKNDWFPFFSMLLWCVIKVVGLVLVVFGLVALLTMLQTGVRFLDLLLTVAGPIALGYVLLSTEIVFDLATAEMKRRETK